MEKFPNASHKLKGAKILIHQLKGADWIARGDSHVVKYAAKGKLFVKGQWWYCGDNKEKKYFELLQEAPKQVKFKGAEMVTRENVFEGLKVLRSPYFRYGAQGEGSDYGIITSCRIHTSVVHVDWVKNDNDDYIVIHRNVYDIGDTGDLMIYKG
jgi:hypothetical protein